MALESFYCHPHSSHSTATSTKPSAKLSKAVLQRESSRQTAQTQVLWHSSFAQSVLFVFTRVVISGCCSLSRAGGGADKGRPRHAVGQPPAMNERSQLGLRVHHEQHMVLHLGIVLPEQPLIITICPSQLFAPRLLLLIKKPTRRRRRRLTFVCE